jgi:16S rRNA (guanine527-N7)-methyltransferase
VSDQFETALRDALHAWRIEPSARQVRALRHHFDAVVDTNRRFNLTRVTVAEEAAVTLYADSVAVIAWAERRLAAVRQVVDAGTGAGFPAVPVAVMQPRWAVHAVDARAKKAAFVEQIARRLELGNLHAEHIRVERLHAPPAYDLVLFKAVSTIAQTLKWSQHVVARGGHVVLYKTPGLPPDEESNGQEMAGRLGYQELDRFDYELPLGTERQSRTLRIFRRG